MAGKKGERQTITMGDLAREIGVSKITVSRALSGHPLVKEETRAKIRAHAEARGYRLNVSARNLRQRRSRTIAVVIEMTPSHDRSMREPYPLSLLGGIMQELTSASYNMVLTTIDLFSTAPPPVDGVILLGQGVHADAVGIVQRTGLPYVTWGASDGDATHVTVGSDNLAGGRAAADHLLARGRKSFAFLGDTGHREVADRLAGFNSRIGKSGARLAGSAGSAFTVDAGYLAMREILSKTDAAIDGVFAANDAIAMGAIRALREAGRNVPDDVSVVGFDDSPGAAFCQPPLTSISQDWEEGGALLARKIIGLTSGESQTSFILPVKLAQRST